MHNPSTNLSANPVFSALADPTRRAVLEHLVRSGTGTPTELSEVTGVSRQAVSKHLGLLADAELVTSSRRGRETIFSPELSGLGTVTQWVAQMETDWNQRLDVLKKIVDG